jgi:2-C-methyl-D-erythritol 4-phosphate cytidylyltransferase/2-C-methyl-D-erythritol 2,4-cyclodiphosphate synthase
VAVIVVAAGSGSRLGAGRAKAFVAVAGKTILERSLHSVSGMSEAVQLVVVAPDHLVEEARAVANTAWSAPLTVVEGGETRQASVASGLAVVDPGVDVVLVHDAARVLCPGDLFDRVVAEVRATGAGVIPGLPVENTIKRMDEHGLILETVDRSELSGVQTPQGFPRDQLVDAYSRASREFTDDAAVMAEAGYAVSVVRGDPRAFKITTPADLHRAEQLIADSTLPAFRIGTGVDTHAFAGDDGRDRELWLACLFWPGERGLAGHSDGDVVSHAITDALLAAAGLGDIGSVFGTSDPRFEGAHGEVFLAETRALLDAAGARIANVSVQLIGNRPRFAARRAEAESAVAAILGASVSISATTTDGLGFTGRGEGVAAIATALVAVQPS